MQEDSITPAVLLDLQQSLRRISELEALANSLSESVKEKSIALTHQKKANKSVCVCVCVCLCVCVCVCACVCMCDCMCSSLDV